MMYFHAAHDHCEWRRSSVNTSAEWATAIATGLLAFVAIFQDWIRGKLWKPNLSLRVRVAPPDCHKTTFNILRKGRNIVTHETEQYVSAMPCYYFRVSIENIG